MKINFAFISDVLEIMGILSNLSTLVLFSSILFKFLFCKFIPPLRFHLAT